MNYIDQSTPEYWDKHYSGTPYQDSIKFDNKFWYKFLDEVFLHNHKILEIGCGVGQYTDYLNNLGHDIIGTDYSKNVIKICKSRYPKSKFKVLDIFKLSSEIKYDAIIAFEVLEHFTNPDLILYKIWKALDDNGKFVFSIPHKDGKFGVWHEHHTLWDYNKLIKSLFMFKKVSFYKINSLTNNQHIFGVAER